MTVRLWTFPAAGAAFAYILAIVFRQDLYIQRRAILAPAALLVCASQ